MQEKALLQENRMVITILGCGTSTGVPLIQCKCKVCRSKNPKNHRLRASIWIQNKGKSILVDTSTDFRQQALRFRIPRVDAVLYTHPHADHTNGIDELRCYNFVQKTAIPLYGNDWTCRELRVRFPYIFNPGPVEGGGIPVLEIHRFEASSPTLEIAGQKVIPISLAHGSQESVGYRINSVAYITDCSLIPSLSLERLRGLDTLILDCVRLTPHRTHFNLEQALDTVSILKPKKTFLTHLGHDFDYTDAPKKLPKGVHFAYDGLKLTNH